MHLRKRGALTRHLRQNERSPIVDSICKISAKRRWECRQMSKRTVTPTGLTNFIKCIITLN